MIDPHLANTDGNCPGNVGSAILKSRRGQFSSVASCCLESCSQVVAGEGRGGGSTHYDIFFGAGGGEVSKCCFPVFRDSSCRLTMLPFAQDTCEGRAMVTSSCYSLS